MNLNTKFYFMGISGPHIELSNVGKLARITITDNHTSSMVTVQSPSIMRGIGEKLIAFANSLEVAA